MKLKDRYLFLMREYVPHVEVAFNELSAIRATSIAYLNEFEAICVDNDMSVRAFVDMFDKILFVRHPEELKEKWATDDGKKASQLRTRVMRSCLVMARENMFDDFVPRDSADLKNADLVCDDEGNPVLPLWLLMHEKGRNKPHPSTGKKKVKKEHTVKYSINSKTIIDTVARNEKTKKPKAAFNERKKIVSRGYPKRAEMGYYALNYLYHLLLKIFTKTRRSAKLTFFTMVGYLFMDWTEHEECEVKNSAVHLRWAKTLRASVLNTWDADDIKETRTFKERSSSTENGNVKTYHEFGRSVDDVVLLVSHDVVVRDETHDSSQRRRQGSDRRVWKKAINLMDVVVRVLELLCGYTSSHPVLDILRAHEFSVPVVYTLARVLRRVLSLLPGRVIQDAPEDTDDGGGNDDDHQRNDDGCDREADDGGGNDDDHQRNDDGCDREVDDDEECGDGGDEGEESDDDENDGRPESNDDNEGVEQKEGDANGAGDDSSGNEPDGQQGASEGGGSDGQ